MKASFLWLRELCPGLPDDPGAVGARLTQGGIEVESIEPFGRGAEGCVVAAVVSARPHPSRGELQIVAVDRGSVVQHVVCGAPDVPGPGALVVLAPAGTHLPAKGLTVEGRSIGGVASDAVLCSEADLGLGDDARHLLVLPRGQATLGAPLADAVPASRDTIFDIALTPNRSDALGHAGLAREAAALFDVPFALPAAAGPQRALRGDFAGYAALTIDAADRCPRYGAAVLVDVGVGPSPAGLRWRLTALGVRPISNVVDVTNLVMLELGHPLHAFDLDTLRGGTLVVRLAREGETLRTLDGVERALSSDDLVVCDGEGPVALAGVMGGAGSEVTASTRRVLLECAYFEARGVRRAARRHGLHTEASHRFERGIDWDDAPRVLVRAAGLVSALSGATAVFPHHLAESRPLARRSVPLRHARVGAVLGTDVEPAQARAILERLGFVRLASRPDADDWEAPSFRPDVAREVDLIEEVGRVRGYDAIPSERPAVRASRDAAPRQGIVRRARQAAVAIGLSEAVTHAFASPADLAMVSAPPATVTLLNPLSEERSVLRTSLLPGLLHAAALARRRGERTLRLFTVGPVFSSAGSRGGSPPNERLALSALLAGDHSSWLAKPRSVDVWDAKGVARALIVRLLGREPVVSLASASERPPGLHPRGASWIHVEGRRVGSMGPLHPDVCEASGAGAGVVVELDLEAIEAAGPLAVKFVPLPRFPATVRDLAVVVDDAVAAGEVERAVREAAGDLAEGVELFDRFVGGGVPAGRASLALHVVYRAPDRTLTDLEVDARHAHVVSAVGERFGATLRS